MTTAALHRERFLVLSFLLAAGSPVRNVRAVRIAQCLGLGYDDALEAVARLHRDGLVRRTGPGSILSGLGLYLTVLGVRRAEEAIALGRRSPA